MKKITVKMTKLNSTVYASIHTHDHNGVATEDDNKAYGYYVDGACGSMQSFNLSEKSKAFASFYYKIGMKVAEGYLAVRI